eukprot:comp21968_c0_seq1/m.50236 comp21968_c0_seq1/g.50236  ORF comp21968_c0_seq1/g.50236 comp21968_c0_seq1/m.50236 type:complete len:795 (+) comp21968_c0_seq1:33-2417(+)
MKRLCRRGRLVRGERLERLAVRVCRAHNHPALDHGVDRHHGSERGAEAQHRDDLDCQRVRLAHAGICSIRVRLGLAILVAIVGLAIVAVVIVAVVVIIIITITDACIRVNHANRARAARVVDIKASGNTDKVAELARERIGLGAVVVDDAECANHVCGDFPFDSALAAVDADALPEELGRPVGICEHGGPYVAIVLGLLHLEEGRIRVQIVARIRRHKVHNDGVAREILCIGLREHRAKRLADRMAIDNHRRDKRELVGLLVKRPGLHGGVGQQAIHELAKLLHVRRQLVRAIHCGCALVALGLVLLKSGRVARVRIAESGDQNDRIRDSSLVGLGNELGAQAATRHCGELARRRNDEQIAEPQNLQRQRGRGPWRVDLADIEQDGLGRLARALGRRRRLEGAHDGIPERIRGVGALLEVEVAGSVGGACGKRVAHCWRTGGVAGALDGHICHVHIRVAVVDGARDDGLSIGPERDRGSSLLLANDAGGLEHVFSRAHTAAELAAPLLCVGVETGAVVEAARGDHVWAERAHGVGRDVAFVGLAGCGDKARVLSSECLFEDLARISAVVARDELVCVVHAGAVDREKVHESHRHARGAVLDAEQLKGVVCGVVSVLLALFDRVEKIGVERAVDRCLGELGGAVGECGRLDGVVRNHDCAHNAADHGVVVFLAEAERGDFVEQIPRESTGSAVGVGAVDKHIGLVVHVAELALQCLDDAELHRGHHHAVVDAHVDRALARAVNEQERARIQPNVQPAARLLRHRIAHKVDFRNRPGHIGLADSDGEALLVVLMIR